MAAAAAAPVLPWPRAPPSWLPRRPRPRTSPAPPLRPAPLRPLPRPLPPPPPRTSPSAADHPLDPPPVRPRCRWARPRAPELAQALLPIPSGAQNAQDSAHAPPNRVSKRQRLLPRTTPMRPARLLLLLHGPLWNLRQTPRHHPSRIRPRRAVASAAALRPPRWPRELPNRRLPPLE